MWQWSWGFRWQNLESCTLSGTKKGNLVSHLPLYLAHLPASFPQLLHLAAWSSLLLPMSSGTYLLHASARPSNSLPATSNSSPKVILSYKETWNEHFYCHKASSRKALWSKERRSWHGAQEKNISLLTVVNWYFKSCSTSLCFTGINSRVVWS